MLELALGIVMLIAFVVLVVWLLSQPEDEDVGELPGLIDGNWWRFRDSD